MTDAKSGKRICWIWGLGGSGRWVENLRFDTSPSHSVSGCVRVVCVCVCLSVFLCEVCVCLSLSLSHALDKYSYSHRFCVFFLCISANERSPLRVTTSREHSFLSKMAVSTPALKVILCGDYGVGKSSLFRRFVDNSFVEESGPRSTIGLDNFSKNFQIEDKLVKVCACWSFCHTHTHTQQQQQQQQQGG